MELVFRPNIASKDVKNKIYKTSMEHHWNYFGSFEHWEKILVNFEDRTRIFAIKNEKSWKVVGNPICRESEWISAIFQFSEHLFSRDLSNKIIIKTTESEHKRWLNLQKHTSEFRIGGVSESLFTPVFQLREWESEGKSSLDKIKRGFDDFFEENYIKNQGSYTSSQLKKIVIELKNSGKIKEFSHVFKIIDSGFEEMNTRILYKDKNPISFVVYWEFQNQTFVGICAYLSLIPQEFVVYDALKFFKEINVKNLDFGYGKADYRNFMNRFWPNSFKKQVVFSLFDARDS